MLPAIFDIEMYQGDDLVGDNALTAVIHRRNTDDSVGPAVDLTGYVGKAQIRANPTSNTVIAEFTVTPDPDQTANMGVVVVSMAHSLTKDIPPTTADRYYWDLQFVAGGLTLTYVKGRVTVDPEVSR